jgi:hypothetical protein
MLFLMPTGAGGFLANLWRKIFAKDGGAGKARPPVLGHEQGVGIDLTAPLTRADRLHVSHGENAE